MKKITKKLKIIFLSAILSLSVQTLVLYYLNNSYFTNNTKLSFKEVNLKPAAAANLEINVDPNAKNITLSPSGKYCSYYTEEKLSIINLIDGTKNSLDIVKDLKNYYFKWHNTEDKLIITEKTIENNKTGIKIYIYNPKNNSKEAALNYNNESKLYKLPTSSSVVSGIELNTMNTIMYLKVSNSKASSSLQRLDISGDMKQLNINTAKVGKFFVVKQKDELIYENLQDNKIYITDKSKNTEIKVPGCKNLKLLYVDKNDTVYVGEFKNDMITKIFKKNFDETSEKNIWNNLNLENPIPAKDIFVLNSGKVYVIDNFRGVLENVQHKTKVNFQGNYLTINDSKILSFYEEKLIITPLN